MESEAYKKAIKEIPKDIQEQVKKEIDELDKLECCQKPEGMYLGTTCPICNKPFRAVIKKPLVVDKKKVTIEISDEELNAMENLCLCKLNPKQKQLAENLVIKVWGRLVTEYDNIKPS